MVEVGGVEHGDGIDLGGEGGKAGESSSPSAGLADLGLDRSSILSSASRN